jgi:hypothetical protein
MDNRLLALAHIDGDLNKVNIYPPKRQKFFARYGRPAPLDAVVSNPETSD